MTKGKAAPFVGRLAGPPFDKHLDEADNYP
jgi:hypothetical protein